VKFRGTCQLSIASVLAGSVATPMLRNYVAQIRDLLLSKVAFVELDVQLIVKQGLENQLEVSNVIIKCGTVDQNIIHKYQHKFSHVFAKDIIHKALKGGWGICKSKRHNSKLKMSMMSFECSLGLI
jgi:hypothetical protein